MQPEEIALRVEYQAPDYPRTSTAELPWDVLHLLRDRIDELLHHRAWKRP